MHCVDLKVRGLATQWSFRPGNGMTAGSTKLIWSWSQRMRSASPTERNYPNAEIVMHVKRARVLV